METILCMAYNETKVMVYLLKQDSTGKSYIAVLEKELPEGSIIIK